MTNNSPMNRISISNSTYVQISCVKYIPLLCRIWPDVIQKSSLFYQQSLGMIQTRVPNSLTSPYSLDDKIRATVQLITYTVPQNCPSIFTIPGRQVPIFSYFSQHTPIFPIFLAISSYFSYFLAILLTISKYLLEI